MRERELHLNNNDWPSHIPGPDVTKEEFYAVLRRIPEVYDRAMAEMQDDSLWPVRPDGEGT